MIVFVGKSGKINNEPPKFAIYEYRNQTVLIDATITEGDAVRRAVQLASGMTEIECDILDSVVTEVRALNGQSINELNPPELNKLVKYMMAKMGYVDAAGNVAIPLDAE